MKVLLPFDGSPASIEVLDWVPRAWEPGCISLLLLMVSRKDDYSKTDNTELLNQAADFLRHHGFTVDTLFLSASDPVGEICRVAEEASVDQIFLGSHRKKRLGDKLLGSISEGVFQRATRPVLVLETDEHNARNLLKIKAEHLEDTGLYSSQPLQVLIPLDDSQEAWRTLTWAIRNFPSQRCGVHLLNVYSCSPEGGYRYPSLEESTKLLADATNLLRRSGFTLVAAESLLGEPASTICQYADDHQIDLIVIGNKGKGGLKKFWVGSVSQEIFQNASQSVLLLNNESEKNIQVTSPEALLLHPGTCDL